MTKLEYSKIKIQLKRLGYKPFVSCPQYVKFTDGDNWAYVNENGTVDFCIYKNKRT